ncbi:MAG: family 10 glycosylhydrolase [Crocinitomicaceae bacterium]|nr:family 10 glycosylhydrolase [Crocinitomicaceae bacterium]
MKSFVCGFFILLGQIGFCQATIDFKIDMSDMVVVPKHYIITKAPKPIKIDGKAEKAWKDAAFTDPFIDIADGPTPKFKTRTKMMWDESYLYIYAELEEPHIWGNLVKRDTIIYLNNDFEVFIDPSPKTEAYAEIELNALNTVWDLLLNKPYRSGGYANFHWNLDDLKTAVRVNGTINDASDEDNRWTVEMAIPMRPIIELKNDLRQVPKEGDQWRMNFSRVEWDYDLIDGEYVRKKIDGKLQREYNWVWSSQTSINMHMPENWGIVQFTNETNSEGVEFNPDPDLIYTQNLYALLREIKWGRLRSVWSMSPLETISVETTFDTDKKNISEVRKTEMGFEITLTSPLSGKKYALNQNGKLILCKEKEITSFTFSTWSHGSKTMDKKVWTKKLETYDSLGITDVLVGGSPEFLSDLISLAEPKGMRIHAWMWTLNRPNDTIANKHPEWYAVNRNNENSLDYKAYVDYYQWLSPFHPEAREYIKSNVRKLLKVDGLASIHLDYVRYVDVILGADLQPKYGLVQDREMPEYDYGYHPIAREQFKALFDKDPLEMEHPELSTEWRQFRLNAITTLVNEIAGLVHAKGQKLTAAVFPFPEMSRQMVRQAWDDWDLDAAYPMIYHNFYRENINWIGFATEQGVNDVDFPINSGLYMPGFESAEDFEKAIRLAKENGAKGITVFTADGMKPEYKEVLIKLNKEL